MHPCGARKYAFADAAPPARLERDGVTKLAAQVRAVPSVLRPRWPMTIGSGLLSY